MREAEASDENGPEVVLERVYEVLVDRQDRELLALWLADMPLFRIAQTTGRIARGGAAEAMADDPYLLRGQIEQGTL